MSRGCQLSKQNLAVAKLNSSSKLFYNKNTVVLKN